MAEPNQIVDIAAGEAARPKLNGIFAILRALLPTSAEKAKLAILGNAATKNVGTTAGTVAAGDDARFGAGGGGSSSSISNGTGSVVVAPNGKTTATGPVAVVNTDPSQNALSVQAAPGQVYESSFVCRDASGNVVLSVRAADGYMVVGAITVLAPPYLSGVEFPGAGAQVRFWDGGGVPDTGLVRRAPGIVKATTGAAGYGKFDAAGYHIGGVNIEVGAPDSGGAGRRALTIAN